MITTKGTIITIGVYNLVILISIRTNIINLPTKQILYCGHANGPTTYQQDKKFSDGRIILIVIDH